MTFLRPALLCCIAIGFLSAPVAAQGRDAVGLVFRGVPAPEALSTLAARTGLNIVFPSDLVRNQPVWCGGRGWTAERLLGCIASAVGLDYVRRSSGTYVLTTRVEEPAQTGSLGGLVVDAETGAPLPRANILMSDARTGTAADARGTFVIAGLLAGAHTITASFAGYEPTQATLRVAPGRVSSGRLALRRRALATAPVVIDGIQARPRSEDLGSGGWSPAGGEGAFATPPSDVGNSGDAVLGIAPRTLRDGISVQGGDMGEHPMQLDGASVYEPLAVGQVLGAFSPLAVGRVTVQKAGFAVRHGSFLTGVIQAEHDLSAPTNGQPVSAAGSLDPLAANGRISVRSALGEWRGRSVQATSMVAARQSLWDITRPSALDNAIRSWNAIDPLLTAVLSDGPAGATRYDVHKHGSDVRFSDVHAATRIELGPLETIRASLYRGRSDIGTELFGRAVVPGDSTAADGLILARDHYHWTNTAGSVRYSSLLGSRVIATAGLALSQHVLRHTAGSLNGLDAGLRGTTSIADAEAQLRTILDSRLPGDDGNRLSEVTADAVADISLSPRHTVSAGVEGVRIGNRFHVGSNGPSSPVFRPLEQDHSTYRLAGVVESRHVLSRRIAVEPGLRTTLLATGGRLFFEPRLAFRYDALDSDPLAGVSLRLASGVYRQFIVREDVATVGPSALVPSMAVWLPVDASVAPPLAFHLASEAVFEPTSHIVIRAEAFARLQPTAYDLDYATLLVPGPPLTRQADFLLTGEGRTFGLGLRAEQRTERSAMAVSYTWTRAERRFDSRLRGRWTSAPWEQPHRLSASADVALAGTATGDKSALLGRFRARGVLGQSWAFRRAYYEVLGGYDDGGTFAPLRFDDPDADRLRTFVEVDVGLAYSRSFGGSRAEVGLDVANIFNRPNVLDWSVHAAAGDGYETSTRLLPGRQVSVRALVRL